MIRIFTASICLLAAAFEPSSAYSSDPPSSFEQLAQRNQQSRPRGGGKPSGRDPAQAISRMDKDGDGRISKSEFLGPGQAFDRIDADGDGYVTKEEFTAILASAGKASDKLSNHPNAAWYAKLPLILTHTHIRPIVSKGRDGREDWEGTVERAIKEMDENGVQASIIMSPPTPFKDYSYFDEIVTIAKKYPT
ncbi:MAG: EF-hand domain-containing protein, partial [Rhodospirillales bacterium]|nr:EF-hand domain-containing protein [Rhodospirillales bacterium]